jgi:hypothetical protein
MPRKILIITNQHVDIQHFSVQGWNNAVDVAMEHISGILNPSDDLTKPLGWLLCAQDHCG